MRFLNAGNSGAFTLDGTRTYIVGSTTVAVIDPGPNAPEHISALVSEVAGAESVSILLTHRHGDHTAGAPALAEATGAPLLGPEGVEIVETVLRAGDAIPTDEGDLVVVPTPGHAPEHVAFHLPARRALFAGDHLLGQGDTTWVGEYDGCVAEYLDSLERIRGLDLDVVYPAHGPPIHDVAATIDRFEAHRRTRIEQVQAVLDARPHAEIAEVVTAVYGSNIPETMQRAVQTSMGALVHHVRTHRA